MQPIAFVYEIWVGRKVVPKTCLMIQAWAVTSAVLESERVRDHTGLRAGGDGEACAVRRSPASPFEEVDGSEKYSRLSKIDDARV